MPTTIRGALIVAAASLLVPFGALAQDKGGKAPPALPDGKAKQLVEGMCASCHALQLITNSSGYSREHWRELVGYMIDLSSSPQQNDILDYLATNFPPNNKRTGKTVSGNVQVTFKEWTMPQLGQRTRDPIQAADGSIWYAGQFGNLIGRLDPKTGQAKEYPLPPNSMPHTVQLDPKGRPWFSGNKNGMIGWIDPATGKATTYKMPDPEAVDVHTITFDKKGWVYFTFQWANMIGRLNPDNGDIKLVKVAAERSQPVRHQVRCRRHAVGLLQRASLPAEGQPGHAGHHGGEASAAGHHGSPLRHRTRRHDLVRELGRRTHRPRQSEVG